MAYGIHLRIRGFTCYSLIFQGFSTHLLLCIDFTINSSKTNFNNKTHRECKLMGCSVQRASTPYNTCIHQRYHIVLNNCQMTEKNIAYLCYYVRNNSEGCNNEIFIYFIDWLNDGIQSSLFCISFPVRRVWSWCWSSPLPHASSETI